MNQSSLLEFTFQPNIPFIHIVIISIIFFAILIFSLINKTSGVLCRIISFLIIIFIILEPSYKIENRNIETDVVTIFIDKTESQVITDRVKKTELVYNQLLDKLKEISNLKILEITLKDNKVIKRFGTYDDLINNRVSKEINLRTKLFLTDIFYHLNRNINQISSKKISTVFILTDGQIHDLKKNTNFEKINSPIYYILNGEKKINDKKVSVISYPEFGYVNEKISLDIKTEDFNSFNNDEINLYIQNGNSPKKTFKIKNNTIKTFEIKLEKSGENFVKIFIDSDLNEISKSNNYKLLKINGIRKKLRVLLVSGEPYMGTRVWRNFLKSDPSVDLIHMTVLRTPEKNDNTPKEELSLIPFPTRELFEEKLYNFELIIFDNFKGKNVLSPLYFENILNFVDQGGAVLEITGPSYNSRESLFRTALGKILPGAPTGNVLRGEFKPNLSDIGKIHPITKSLFNEFKDYGKWYEMNKISDINDRALTLLLGIDKNPLLTINRINNGRIAQIYSHNLWLWTKTNNNNGGPYNLLIKNLAHWLMKEPTLEENKLTATINEKDIIINKRFFSTPQKEDLKFSIIDPDGKKISKILKKSIDNEYSYNFRFKKKGVFIISDGNIVINISTDNFKKLEYENLNLTDEIILNNSISTYKTKPIWIDKKNKLPEIRTSHKLDKDISKENFLYVLKKNNFVVDGINTKKIVPLEISILCLAFFLIMSWKKESQ